LFVVIFFNLFINIYRNYLNYIKKSVFLHSKILDN